MGLPVVARMARESRLRGGRRPYVQQTPGVHQPEGPRVNFPALGSYGVTEHRE